MDDSALTNSDAENHLVAKLGQQEVTCDELLERLIIKKQWKLIEESLEQILIDSLFSRYNIEASEQEVHEQITQFRQQNGLISGEQTQKWLEQNHMEDEHFLSLCRFEVQLRKLKATLLSDKIEEHFIYKRLQLVKVELYRIVLTQEEAAREIISSVKEGAGFYAYARKYSIDSETAESCGYTGKVPITQFSPQVQDLLSKSSAGDIIGPVKFGQNFEIYLVDKIHTPELNQEMRQQLEDELFAQWLAEFKSRCAIELFI